MDLNKVPRWALILFSSLFFVVCGLTVSGARADLDKFGAIAYDAKNASDGNTKSISELKASVQEVRDSQEQFRREYRDDQKTLDVKLTELLKAVKR